MNNYVIYKEFDKLRLTNEKNYNAFIRNASQITDCSKFKDAQSLREYLIREWNLLPSQINDKTSD